MTIEFRPKIKLVVLLEIVGFYMYRKYLGMFSALFVMQI